MGVDIHNENLETIKLQMDALIDALPEGLLMIDGSGNILRCNKVAKKYFGKCQGIAFSDQFADDFFGFSMKEVLAHPRLIKPIRNEGNIISWVVPNTEGGIFLFFNNISKGLYAKAATESASFVAHEIRNPLGGMKGFASLLLDDLQQQPELQKLVERIVKGADHLDEMLTKILSSTRPLEPHFQEMDLCTIIEDIRVHFEADPETTDKIHLVNQSDEKSVVAMIDPVLINAALINLIKNSIHAMPEGGEITLSLTTKAHHVDIKVQDTGVGIEKNDLSKIFIPLFTTKAKGYGFGLPEVLKVVDAHNGEIEVSSVEGEGTTVTMSIPLIQEIEG